MIERVLSILLTIVFSIYFIYRIKQGFYRRNVEIADIIELVLVFALLVPIVYALSIETYTLSETHIYTNSSENLTVENTTYIYKYRANPYVHLFIIALLLGVFSILEYIIIYFKKPIEILVEEG